MPTPLQLATRAACSAALLNVAYRSAIRPHLATWGATEDEARASLPADDILPLGAPTTTMATTIHAPPPDLWPWLVQMGCGRAGWYSHDRLDNGGRPSANQIVPAWQEVSLGDRLSTDPTGHEKIWFTIERIYPERALTLRASIDMSNGHSYDPGGTRPRAYSDSTWTFVLRELPEHRTRLLVRTRGDAAPVWRAALINSAVGLPSHVIMQLRQFRNLKLRVEDIAAPPLGAASSRQPQPVASP